MNPKEMTNEELANILDALCLTGISPSRTERECLHEASDRLRREGEKDEE